MHDLNSLPPQTLAAQLNAATSLGNLADAYRLIRSIDKRIAPQVLLRAGFAITDENKPSFFGYAQRQIAQACAQRLTGYQLTAGATS